MRDECEHAGHITYRQTNSLEVSDVFGIFGRDRQPIAVDKNINEFAGLPFDKAQQGGSMMTTALFVYGVLSRPDENRTYP
jgi:hypothetical protein